MDAEKTNQLQLLQQNLQNILLQKQQIQNQIIELDSALTELKTTNASYRILGKIMLAVSKEKLTLELKEKKELMEVRLKNILKQEEKFQQAIEKIQEELTSELRKEKKK